MMSSFRSFILVFCLGLMLAPSLKAQNYIGDQAEIDQILKKVKTFSSYVINGEYDALAEAYTADAKIFVHNKDIIHNRDSIKAYWGQPRKSKTIHHKVDIQELKILGDEAYDYGYYEGKSQLEDGSIQNWRGKYVIIWRKVEGDWKIYLDIWNGIRD